MRTVNGNFELQVLVHGRPVTEYPHQGETFIEGRKGSEYTLRVHNHTARRVVVVVSVDGLSVISGKTASQHDSGYIINKYSHADIPGWRLNNSKVAHFYFGKLPEAYAAQMGNPTNIGVIGAVIFFEREAFPDFNLESLGPMRGAETLGGKGSTRGIGTGFGRTTQHHVTNEEFDREGSPSDRIVLRYDDARGLRNRGIHITSSHQSGDRVVDADPFPRDTGCEPPPGWHG